MQKLISLFSLATPENKPAQKHDTSQTRPLHIGTQNARRNYEDDTRPTYRIGKHDPADIQRAIDLAG